MLPRYQHNIPVLTAASSAEGAASIFTRCFIHCITAACELITLLSIFTLLCVGMCFCWKWFATQNAASMINTSTLVRQTLIRISKPGLIYFVSSPLINEAASFRDWWHSAAARFCNSSLFLSIFRNYCRQFRRRGYIRTDGNCETLSENILLPRFN